jgi:tRNA/tmRNA/rRNA uracil-C5-methylase (TrmA/RlmC/RlmD family)
MASIELTLGRPAAGGGFVARDGDGRVVFVRHGIEGERVRVTLTEEKPTFARGDVTEVLEPSPNRVTPPCHLAGPGKCGGCDYQHITLAEQRSIKGALLAEQLRRLAKIDLEIEVEKAPGPEDGLGTRTRLRHGVTRSGRLAMRKHRSHDLLAVDSCPLGVAGLVVEPPSEGWPPGGQVELTSLGGDTSVRVITGDVDDLGPSPGYGGTTLWPEVLDRRFRVSPGSFFQVHTAAPAILTTLVLEGLDLRGGEDVIDLYCGVGLFTTAIAASVGEAGAVVGLESSPTAARDAQMATVALPWAEVICSKVTPRALAENLPGCTHLVMDPPRSGVDRRALDFIASADDLRRIVSVSCDPATFARDLRVLLDTGWQLGSLRAIDLFEMTEHMEIVATLARS